MSFTVRVLLIGIGVLCVILGFVGLAVPLMPGFIFFGIGIVCLSSASPTCAASSPPIPRLQASCKNWRKRGGWDSNYASAPASALLCACWEVRSINTTESLRIAVMGALAYDVIGNTDKVFDESGPGLNCKVTDQQEFFGGCAGNIAYGLNVTEVPLFAFVYCRRRGFSPIRSTT